MFNQKTFSDVHGVEFEKCVCHVVHFYNNEYFARGVKVDKTKVSIKELRNILAVEHNATKKELVVRKWYKHPKGSIYFINHECERGHLYGYGFDENGNWDVRHQSNSRYCAFNSVAKHDVTEATPKEVEEALIKEANRRYKVGDLIEKISEWNIGNYPCDNKENSFKIRDVEDVIYSENILSYGNLIVFKDGKWAEVIKPEKSIEERVKELEDVVGLLWEKTKLR